MGIDDLLTEVETLENGFLNSDESKGLFTVKPANKWIELAKTRPIPKMLFGELWFENELCILFADTNLGKSILAVQIGNSISKGEFINGFTLEAIKQPILYFDFELSDKQFENRYSINFDQHYNFDDNFIRVEINPDADIPANETFESYLNNSLERSIIDTDAKILIIDNLTYLKNETEKSKDALPLMKHLKALKSKYGLSILALAHTPKRDLTKPITRNDLAGSKMLINFVVICFSIGESNTDKQLRYIKQIKARNTEIIYDTENVAVCQIDKPHNFLEFEFVDYGNENEHLRQVSKEDKEMLESNIIELKSSNPNISFGDIAKQLGTNKMKVKRTLDKYSKS
ncbi:LuxR family transcriptional regulator [Pseudalgibacter alginicilyticus]|uniref:LuxR family transcriptional regulator n=1 Tax=Pseudalgibacter alginicilyticus TaxID=1736674 RepID=A0A0N7HZ07_9FLAO|nr:LuxR family transcriptional regulator [Pseudalgibacter alginicilyticus]